MILTACDERYLQEAKALIRSCAHHEPSQRFYLFLVNSHRLSDAELRRWHPNLLIERVDWSYDKKNWRGIMCCARSIPIMTVLKQYNEPVVYLDSDMLLRGSISGIFKLLEYADLTIKYRPGLGHIGAAGTPYASEFNSGLIGIRPSEAGIQFATRYNQLLRDYIASGNQIVVERPEYHIQTVIDQEFLFVAYKSLDEIIKFIPLPTSYNDAHFAPDSIVWHGKGTARHHPLYKVERARYESGILFYPGIPINRLLIWLRSMRKFLQERWGST